MHTASYIVPPSRTNTTPPMSFGEPERRAGPCLGTCQFRQGRRPQWFGLPAWPAFRSPAGGFIHFLPEGPAAEEGLRRAQCEVYMENVNRLARGR